MFDQRASKRNEIDALRDEVERLRAFVETRAQAQEDMIRAITLDGRRRFAEALEERIQLASREAIAFAEQGLMRHEAALRAVGRRVAELSRETPAPEKSSTSALATPPALAYLIGSAEGADDGCRRIELRDEREETFLSDLANLPILPGGAATLVARHIVEFVPARELAEKLLPHWRERLAPGGELVIVTLDGPAWAADLARNADDFEDIRARLGANGAGRPLRNLFDADGLRQILIASGFTEVGPVEREKDGFALSVVAR